MTADLGQTPRVLFIVVARNDENSIVNTLSCLKDLPQGPYRFEILLIDDASTDQTFHKAQAYAKKHSTPPIQVLKNPLEQGYGGNWKAGFRYAIERGFDVVVPISSREIYSPQAIAALLRACDEEAKADCVLGYAAGSPAGYFRWFRSFIPWSIQGMLCNLQNKLAKSRLQAWHTIYQAYRTRGLAQIAFELNSTRLHFNTEVLLQLIDKNLIIRETALPIPRGFYSERLHSLSYAKDILKATLKYKLQKYNLFYDVRYHPEFLRDDSTGTQKQKIYHEKFELNSPHSFVCHDPTLILPGSKVLDIGCSTGYVAQALIQAKNCQVTGVDLWPASHISETKLAYHQIDIENNFEKLKLLIEKDQFDVILLLDVIEHLAAPEKFLLQLYKIRYQRYPKFIVSTPNVAFAPVRMMLLFGYFNYGEKGILDVTHKRLFTLRTFKNLFDQTGFIILGKRGFPVPFRALGFPLTLSHLLEKFNGFLIRIRISFFAYQIMFIVTPLQSMAWESSSSDHFGLPELDSPQPSSRS